MTNQPPPNKNEQLAASVKNSKAPAISRAAAIMHLLGDSETPLGVHAIARELGLVPSTVLNVLRALVGEQFVAMDPDTKRYSLDAGVLTLARHWLGRNQFTNLAQPIIDQLSLAHNVTTMGVQVFGLEHVIVVNVSEANTQFQLRAQLGSRFPALVSATGRCLAAFSDAKESELRARFANLRWDNAPTLEQWLGQIAEAKQHGYALDDGNYIEGVTVVAVPVWKDNSTPSHALVALSIGGAVKRQGLSQLQSDLQKAARQISNQLIAN